MPTRDWKEKRNKKIAAGLCVFNQECPEDALPNLRFCHEHHEHSIIIQGNRRKRRLKSGVCPRCGEYTKPGKKACSRCLEINRIGQLVYRVQRRKRLRELGLCQECGKRPPEWAKTSCHICVFVHKIRRNNEREAEAYDKEHGPQPNDDEDKREERAIWRGIEQLFRRQISKDKNEIKGIDEVPSKFTSENIVKILISAEKGGTYQEVLRRAAVDITIHNLTHWISYGRKANKEGRVTAYSLFAEMWEERHLRTGNKTSEDEKLHELRVAQKVLSETKNNKNVR